MELKEHDFTLMEMVQEATADPALGLPDELKNVVTFGLYAMVSTIL